jgi:hypothetical protein
MQNVPKIVGQRLKAAIPASNHPDANVLTAFAERSLAEGERAVVLEHLGRCSDCRDIVALALPATEPVQAIASPSRSGWLTWPSLRWRLATAGIVAIAALGVVQYHRGGRSLSQASTAPARFEVAAKEARNQPLASPATATTDKKADSSQASSSPGLANSMNAANATGDKVARIVPGEAPTTVVPQVNLSRSANSVIGGTLPHGPRMPNQWQQQKDFPNQASGPASSSPFAKQQGAGDLSANVQPPGVSQTVEVGSQSAQLDTQGQDMNAIQLEERQSKDQPAASPPPSGEDYAAARVGKAKPAGSAPSASGAALASTVATPMPSQATDSELLTLSAPVPRWTIDSTGVLQRSFDQGATWQAVNVNANPAYFTNATSLQISGKTSRSKARKVLSPTFRAVAATGTDVWAGGSGGALYHSGDAGDHWTRVVPASAGAILSGDIVSLEFGDMQHGKVSTSTPEVWTTSDAGQTWQKQ